MFVVTADQIGSRSHPDAVPAALDLVRTALPATELLRGPRRTVGDEFQLVLADPTATLDTVLLLTRHGGWSVGCGVGGAELPLPHDAREARGPVFVAARDAVEAAKKRPTRFALRCDPASVRTSDDVEPLVDLLLAVRARRSDEGWAVFDLLRDGLSQRAVAERLGVSDQAVSARARAAEIRPELAARPALVRLLAEADSSAGQDPA